MQEQFDDPIHTRVVFDGVAESPILKRGEDAGRGDLIFGVADSVGGASTQSTLTNQEFEKGLNGIEFATNTFERIFLVFEALFELLEMIGGDVSSTDNPHFLEENDELVKIFGIG